jgi:hypothetical protein
MPEQLNTEDFTQDTSFGNEPPSSQRNSEHQRRVSAVLQTYVTPLLKYDGISAWEIAGKILDVIAEPEDSIVRR